MRFPFPFRTYILLAGLLWSALFLTTPLAANAGTILGHPTYIGLGSGLVGYWSLNGDDIAQNSSGRLSAFDRSGNGNHASSTSGTDAPKGVVGKLGQALDFDGSDDSTDLSTNPSLAQLGPMTVSLWMYPQSTGQNGYGGFVSNDATGRCSSGGPSPSDGWTFGFDPIGGTFLCFGVGLTSNLEVSSNDNVITLNKWQHVVLTWDGGLSETGVHFYVDTVDAGQSFSVTPRWTPQNRP